MKYSANKFLSGVLTAATVLLTCVTTTSLAHAAALHGFCTGTTAACVDNGTNTLTTDTTPDFGFWDASGPKTGNFVIDFLVANTVANASSLSFSVTQDGGGPTTAASLFNSTAWSSGFLDTYLGFNAAPNNPIGAYLGADPGATGFFVYQANSGTMTIDGSASTSPSFTMNSALPVGAYILGFLSNTTATANSAAILISPVPEPQTYAMLLAGLGLIGFTTWRRKQNLGV